MSIEFTELQIIGWPWVGAPDDTVWQDCMHAHPASRPARVVEQHRTGYVVSDHPERSFLVESLPDWQRPRLQPEQRPAVGDWLLIEGMPDDSENQTLPQAVALLPRRSLIKRAVAGEHYGQQMIAANVDTVLVVCALDNDFNLRRIERYLLLVQGDAQAVIVLTKADRSASSATGIDLTTAEQALAAFDVPVVGVNATDADSVSQLADWLGPGVTAVVVGSSGAGKSTLTNSLLGHERMKTGAVRATDDRGRHTTTHRALIPLPSGACLIDTPGMRELKPTAEETLEDGGFADIIELATRCRFRNCQHEKEPGCALQAAIAAGTLDAARLANYLKLSTEVAGAAQRKVAREAPKSGVRTLSKAEQRRLDQRYGKE